MTNCVGIYFLIHVEIALFKKEKLNLLNAFRVYVSLV